VNLSAAATSGTIQYFKPDGTAWKLMASLWQPMAGRQFSGSTRQSLGWSGFVVVSAGDSLTVVQIGLATKTRRATAYSGFSAGSVILRSVGSQKPGHSNRPANSRS
jgi:hypothetical protein